jgi:hypothetical protein
LPVTGHGEFTNERQSVSRVQLDVLTVRRKLNTTSYFNHLACNLPTVSVPMPALSDSRIIAEHVVGPPRHEMSDSGCNFERASGAGVGLDCRSGTDRLNDPFGTVADLGSASTHHQ